LTKNAPYKGLGADSEEKHEPVSDIYTVVVVDGLKALDPNGRLEKRPNRCVTVTVGVVESRMGAVA
jgi:hypothetical protein